MTGRLEFLRKKRETPTERAAQVADLLERNYGRPQPAKTGKIDPMEQLVSTILSQNTNDINRDRAMDELTARFSTWEEIAEAHPKSIEAAVRVGGLGHQKSRRIKEVLRWIKDTFGEYSLEPIKDMSTEEAYSMLTRLKGIGPKTASIVLLFGFGRPVFPVDTHIYRVTGRLGLLPEGASYNAAHRILGNIFEAENYYPVHINLIRHGREVCKWRKPLCSECFLSVLCPWPANNEGSYI